MYNTIKRIDEVVVRYHLGLAQYSIPWRDSAFGGLFWVDNEFWWVMYPYGMGYLCCCWLESIMSLEQKRLGKGEPFLSLSFLLVTGFTIPFEF